MEWSWRMDVRKGQGDGGVKKGTRRGWDEEMKHDGARWTRTEAARRQRDASTRNGAI